MSSVTTRAAATEPDPTHPISTHVWRFACLCPCRDCPMLRCCAEQGEAKTGRKLAYQAKRRMGLEERKREAERRKAEVMKTCAGGGMKHTATAMMNRA